MRKVYVSVRANYSIDEAIVPLSFTWDDGREFEIDKIIGVKPAASIAVGGFGERYTIRVQGKETYLWLENGVNKWFMEGKDNDLTKIPLTRLNL